MKDLFWLLEYTERGTDYIKTTAYTGTDVDAFAKALASSNKSKVRIYTASYSYSVRKPAEQKV